MKVLSQRKFYGDRRFSTMSVNMIEALTLSVGDLQKITSEFPQTFTYFYQEQSELLEQVVVARIHCTDLIKENMKDNKIGSNEGMAKTLDKQHLNLMREEIEGDPATPNFALAR